MRDPVIIGRFGRVFGIKGWIHVISFTQPPENILSYYPWRVMLNKTPADLWPTLDVTHHHLDKKGLRVKLKDCESPEDAQYFVNKDIAVSKDLLPPLKTDQYYWAELEGLLVKNTQNIILGHVDYLFETGANDVLVVKGEKVHLIPFLESTILRVDFKEKVILVDWDPNF